MIVYRLESNGPFHEGPFTGGANQVLGFVTDDTLEISPAQAAQVEAEVEGVRGPFQMPPIPEDVDDLNALNDFGRKINRQTGALPSFGFVSMEQYHEWFRTQRVREALFTKVSFSHDPHPKERNNMELHRYEVDEEYVFNAKHQLVFVREYAKDLGVVPYEEAVK